MEEVGKYLEIYHMHTLSYFGLKSQLECGMNQI